MYILKVVMRGVLCMSVDQYRWPMFLEQVVFRNMIERHRKLTWGFAEQYEASLHLPPEVSVHLGMVSTPQFSALCLLREEFGLPNLWCWQQYAKTEGQQLGLQVAC